ncbi:MAG: AAA family ATPase [Lachnospiraceae bacterium]|nr:AAA family ATPase [Lachnospiraceae bacterium]
MSSVVRVGRQEPVGFYAQGLFPGQERAVQGVAIDSLEKEWAEYPVFHLDFNGENFNEPGQLKSKLKKWVADYESIYGKNPHSSLLGDRFKNQF